MQISKTDYNKIILENKMLKERNAILETLLNYVNEYRKTARLTWRAKMFDLAKELAGSRSK